MMTEAEAQAFAQEWVEAWNSHDLDRILSHYTDDFEMSSPLIIDLMQEPSGTLAGKTAIRDYWTKGLARSPALHFELIDVLIGANSLVIYYYGRGRRTVAEVMIFNEQGRVVKSMANYSAKKDE